MPKKRTSVGLGKALRQGAALFLGLTALWLVWLTGDPQAAADRVRELAENGALTTALLSAELGGESAGNSLSWLDRLILAQSPLLGLDLPAPREEAVPSPSLPPVSTPSPAVSQTPVPGQAGTDEGIIPKTMVAGTSAKYVTLGGVSVYNHTDYTLDLTALLDAVPDLTARGEGPQVLIFHSHATEAYTMAGEDVYQPSDDYRTLDTRQNMVRVGSELAAILESAGIEVIHDQTLYDYPSYNEAYVRSSQGVAKWLEKYPSITLVLDLHRDALEAEDGTIYKTVAGTVDQCAQIMMVVGSDAAGQSHPNWRVNLSLAAGLQQALCSKWATLARPIVLRTTRFNQHQSTGALLIEIGTHGNTLQEAITAARLLGRTLAEQMTA